MASAPPEVRSNPSLTGHLCTIVMLYKTTTSQLHPAHIGGDGQRSSGMSRSLCTDRSWGPRLRAGPGPIPARAGADRRDNEPPIPSADSKADLAGLRSAPATARRVVCVCRYCCYLTVPVARDIHFSARGPGSDEIFLERPCAMAQCVFTVIKRYLNGHWRAVVLLAAKARFVFCPSCGTLVRRVGAGLGCVWNGGKCVHLVGQGSHLAADLGVHEVRADGTRGRG